MPDILPFLKSMIAAPGLSGHEAPIASIIEEKWTPLVDEISYSRLGSLHGLKRGSYSGKAGRPSVLISTHMDGIGLMVTHINGEFLRVTSIGGVDPRVLPGTPVLVHASGSGADLYGVVAMPPANLLPEGQGAGAVALKYLLIDTGLSAASLAKQVQVGDRVSFKTEPTEMSAGTLSGHTLDNRASVAALTICLETLQTQSHIWDLWAVASTQEEVTLGGAITSTYQLRPTVAVALDVTFGKGTGASDHRAFALGKGLPLGIGPSIHPYLHKRFKTVVEKIEIPVKDEVMPEHSSTDADGMQLAADGVPTMVLSIPLRYMHTPVEMVSMKDVQRAGRLLAAFVSSLEEDFMDGISWD